MFRLSKKVTKAHRDSVWAVSWGDGDKVVSASVDGSVHVWDAARLDPLSSLEGHQLGVVSTAVSGNTLVTSALDSQIRVFDLDTGRLQKTIDAGPVEAWTVDLHKDGDLIASGSQKGAVNLWTCGGRKTCSIDSGGTFTMDVAFSPDGRAAASGGHDGVSIACAAWSPRFLLRLFTSGSVPSFSLVSTVRNVPRLF